MGKHVQHDRSGSKKRFIAPAFVVLAALTVVSATVVQWARLQSALVSFPLQNSSQTIPTEPDPLEVYRSVRLGALRDDVEALLGAPDEVKNIKYGVALFYYYEIDLDDSDQVGHFAYIINVDNRVERFVRIEDSEAVESWPW